MRVTLPVAFLIAAAVVTGIGVVARFRPRLTRTAARIASLLLWAFGAYIAFEAGKEPGVFSGPRTVYPTTPVVMTCLIMAVEAATMYLIVCRGKRLLSVRRLVYAAMLFLVISGVTRPPFDMPAWDYAGWTFAVVVTIVLLVGVAVRVVADGTGLLHRATLGVLLTLVAAGTSSLGLSAMTRQSPTLRASIDLVTIDVQVVAAKDAATIRALTAADFEITVAGRKREAASVTFLHYDEGTVTSNPASRESAAGSPECAFGFHRKKDRRTAHYLIGVDRTDADQKQVKDVGVKTTDKTLVVEFYGWRSPIRRSGSPR